MGAYISQTDVENVFGVDNVTAWSDLAGGATADTTRIALAIAYAEALVEDSFRGGRYAVPLSPVVEVLKDWCAKLAGTWLFFCRPNYRRDKTTAEGFAEVRKDVFDEIATYLSGQRILNCNKATDKDVSGPVAI